MNLLLHPPTDSDFKQICKWIDKFELDNRELKKEEFYAAYHQDELIGFGRLRKHKDCRELCSLGVLIPFRGKGVGKALTAALLKSATTPVYVVCIIPDFFNHFGFKQVISYPLSIAEKLAYCTHSLPVDEIYVAMRLD